MEDSHFIQQIFKIAVCTRKKINSRSQHKKFTVWESVVKVNSRQETKQISHPVSKRRLNFSRYLRDKISSSLPPHLSPKEIKIFSFLFDFFTKINHRKRAAGKFPNISKFRSIFARPSRTISRNKSLERNSSFSLNSDHSCVLTSKILRKFSAKLV